jgi:ribosome-associated protein
MTSEIKPRKIDIQKLQRAIVDGLEDVKGQDISVFNTEHLSPLFERVIIASGTSNRQTKALASSVSDAVREAGFPKPRVEGQDNGEWIIVDCGAAVAHVMQPSIRQYYHLEEIWGGKSVRLKHAADEKKDPPVAKKSTAVAKTTAKTASSKSAAAKPSPVKTVAAKPTTTKSAATRKPAAKADSAKAAPVKAPVSSKTATAKSAAAPTGVRKRAAASASDKPKAPALKVATVKTLVVGKPAARKTVAGKSAAPRKSPARKSAG